MFVRLGRFHVLEFDLLSLSRKIRTKFTLQEHGCVQVFKTSSCLPLAMKRSHVESSQLLLRGLSYLAAEFVLFEYGS